MSDIKLAFLVGILVCGPLAFVVGCDIPKAEPVSAMDGIQTVNYKGHSYVLWIGYNKGAMVHDPDCACQKKASKQ